MVCRTCGVEADANIHLPAGECPTGCEVPAEHHPFSPDVDGVWDEAWA